MNGWMDLGLQKSTPKGMPEYENIYTQYRARCTILFSHNGEYKEGMSEAWRRADIFSCHV
jgi:hypothetical protein